MSSADDPEHPGVHEDQDPEEQGYVLVPADALSAEALEALIEEFVTREGTDYGLREYTLPEKVQSVKRQLERGDVVIAFDLQHSSATLLARTQLYGRDPTRS